MPSVANLDRLLALENTNDIVIELDNAISDLCAYGEEIEKLTEPQKNFFYNQSLEKEINNGGFKQYFMNSSGDCAHETIQSLKIIGAHKTAAILQQAIDEFPSGQVPKDWSKRNELLESIEDRADEIWEGLDQQFYNYDDDLNSLNLEYVIQNRSSF